MGLVELLFVASMPVVKVLLITAVGLVLALNSVNLLGKDARIQVNNVTPWTLNEVLSSFFLSPFVYCTILYMLLITVFHLWWQLVHYVLYPALVGGNLADTITYENVVLLWVLILSRFCFLLLNYGFQHFWLWFRWFMPVNILLTFIIGSALGWILVKLTRAPKHLEGLIIGVCSAGRVFSS